MSDEPIVVMPGNQQAQRSMNEAAKRAAAIDFHRQNQRGKWMQRIADKRVMPFSADAYYAGGFRMVTTEEAMAITKEQRERRARRMAVLPADPEPVGVAAPEPLDDVAGLDGVPGDSDGELTPDIDTSGFLTDAEIRDLTKGQLIDYGETHGIQLNPNDTKDVLIEQLVMAGKVMIGS